MLQYQILLLLHEHISTGTCTIVLVLLKSLAPALEHQLVHVQPQQATGKLRAPVQNCRRQNNLNGLPAGFSPVAKRLRARLGFF